MPKSPRYSLITIASALLLLASAATISAQTLPTNPMNPANPTMASRQFEDEKEALYAQFNDFKRNPNPEQQRFAYQAAKDYMRRFGGDSDAETKEVRRFVTGYEQAMHEHELYTAFDAKTYAKMFELGRPLLKSEPENFFVLAILTEAGYESALGGNAGLNTETTDYARRAIHLIEAGKATKADPFKNLELARGYLNSALGWFLRDQSPVEAAAAFLKAAQSDSPYRTDPSIYHRLGVAIIKGEFTQLSAKYNEQFGAKPPSPEQGAMLERILHLAERAMDAYARAVALSTKPEQQEARAKILAQLTALYKNFHNNSDAGLNELISTVLSKPILPSLNLPK